MLQIATTRIIKNIYTKSLKEDFGFVHAINIHKKCRIFIPYNILISNIAYTLLLAPIIIYNVLESSNYQATDYYCNIKSLLK